MKNVLFLKLGVTHPYFLRVAAKLGATFSLKTFCEYSPRSLDNLHSNSKIFVHFFFCSTDHQGSQVILAVLKNSHLCFSQIDNLTLLMYVNKIILSIMFNILQQFKRFNL